MSVFGINYIGGTSSPFGYAGFTTGSRNRRTARPLPNAKLFLYRSGENRLFASESVLSSLSISRADNMEIHRAIASLGT